MTLAALHRPLQVGVLQLKARWHLHQPLLCQVDCPSQPQHVLAAGSSSQQSTSSSINTPNSSGPGGCHTTHTCSCIPGHFATCSAFSRVEQCAACACPRSSSTGGSSSSSLPAIGAALAKGTYITQGSTLSTVSSGTIPVKGLIRLACSSSQAAASLSCTPILIPILPQSSSPQE